MYHRPPPAHVFVAVSTVGAIGVVSVVAVVVITVLAVLVVKAAAALEVLRFACIKAFITELLAIRLKGHTRRVKRAIRKSIVFFLFRSVINHTARTTVLYPHSQPQEREGAVAEVAAVRFGTTLPGWLW